MKIELHTSPAWWKTRGGMAAESGFAIRELVVQLRADLEASGHFVEFSVGRHSTRGGWEDTKFHRRFGAVGTHNYVADSDWNQVTSIYRETLRQWAHRERAGAPA